MRAGTKRDFARHLRRRSTDAERLLWSKLRAKQLGGHRFRRQHPLGPYVVELDGGEHAGSGGDAARDAWLEGAGVRVLRFWNNDVLLNTAGVCEAIAAALGPHPGPPLRAGEGTHKEDDSP